jgi:hypothetical protein
MHTAGMTGHHARWPGRGAFLEAGAAVRTLVARLVIGTESRFAGETKRADVEFQARSRSAPVGDQAPGTIR